MRYHVRSYMRLCRCRELAPRRGLQACLIRAAPSFSSVKPRPTQPGTLAIANRLAARGSLDAGGASAARSRDQNGVAGRSGEPPARRRARSCERPGGCIDPSPRAAQHLDSALVTKLRLTPQAAHSRREEGFNSETGGMIDPLIGGKAVSRRDIVE
jgi:hypothetical protein